MLSYSQWNVYRWTIIPLSILFSASLILSNVAYVHLSVSFVQMLKVGPAELCSRWPSACGSTC